MKSISHIVKKKQSTCLAWKLVMALAVGILCLAASQSANAQFFNLPTQPQVGDLPVSNAGVRAQNQGYFMKNWWQQGRTNPPVSPYQGSAFNPPPWGGPPNR
jgi:hypothetical protein